MRALSGCKQRTPTLLVRLFITTLGSEALVLRGRCGFALVTADTPIIEGDRLERRYLCETRFVTVCTPAHPLAGFAEPIPAAEFERHTQLVISNHTAQTEDFSKGVVGERNWFLADLAAKHDFLLGGLGWGHIPEDRVADDLASGRLIKLALVTWGDRSPSLVFAISTRRGRQQTASESWLIDQLKLADKHNPRSGD